MTDTATEGAMKTPVQILEITRAVFAASHWITGAFADVRPSADGGKVVGCAVGGLRYAALAPMEHALDESWMVAHFQETADGGIPYSGYIDYEDRARAYLAAIEALAEEAIPNRFADYRRDCTAYEDLAADIFERITRVEDQVVDWNDKHDYETDDGRLAVVAAEILPVFDRAIRKLSTGETTERSN